MSETDVATIAKVVATKMVPIDSLVRFPGNAKVGNIEVIQDSLRLNGQYKALTVWHYNNWILAGNHTWDAAKAEGWKKILVSFVECDERTARRINLVDNRSAELGHYDPAELMKLVGEMPSLEGTGWTAEDLQKELGKLPTPEDMPGTGLNGGEVPDDNYQAQFGVIVVCVDQEQQELVYGELQGLAATNSALDGVELKIVAI